MNINSIDKIDDNNAWNAFTKTGKINDYINYISVNESDEEVNLNVAHHNGRIDNQRTKSGRERPADYNSYSG